MVEGEHSLDCGLATGGPVDGGDDGTVCTLAEGVQDTVFFANDDSDLGIGDFCGARQDLAEREETRKNWIAN